MKTSQDQVLARSLTSVGQQHAHPKDNTLISSYNQENFNDELVESVKMIGFRKVTLKDDKVIYGIDNSRNSLEKNFYVFDLELFERSNRKYQCLRSYFSKKSKPFSISKTYFEYIILLISKINQQLTIGSFFYLNSTCQVYFEISQIMPKYISTLRRSTSRMTDEVVSAMTYSKCFYLFIQYLKSIKSHFKNNLKKRTPLPAGLSKEIDETMTSFVMQGYSFYQETRAKDISLGRAYLYPSLDFEKEVQFIKDLKTSPDLAALFFLNKYSADEQQVRVPIYHIGKGYTEKTFYSSKIFILAEKILTSPKLLTIFQEYLLVLVKKGFRLDLNEIPEKVRKVCHDNVIGLVHDPVFYSFIVTPDNRILFAYDEFKQLSNSLVKIEKQEDREFEEIKTVEKIFEASLRAFELSCLDLSIIHIDIDKFIGKVEN